MAEYLLKWLLPRLAQRAVLIALLLLIATLSAINGLNKALPQLDDQAMLGLSLLSFGLSWALTSTRLSARQMIGSIVVSGLILVSLYYGKLLTPSLKLLWSLGDWLTQIRYTTNFDTTPLDPAWQSLTQAMSQFLHRLTTWGQAILHNSPTFDRLTFELIWGLTSWLGTSWAVWWLRRQQQPLTAMLPLGGLLVITCAYRQSDLMPLATLMAAMLMLQVIVTYYQHEQLWLKQGLDFSLEIKKDVVLVMLPLIFILMLLATFTPPLSLLSLTLKVQPWLYQASPKINPLANFLGLKPVIKSNTAVDKARLGGLPRNHLIGTGSELTHETVMLIQVSSPVTRPLYWRALTYDTYTGQGWLTGQVNTLGYIEAETTKLRPSTGQTIINQRVQMMESAGGFLYVAGSLVTVNEPYQVSWRDTGDIFATTINAKQYSADSIVSVATADELRGAADNYPSDIETHYLTLPPDLPQRIVTLAHDLTLTAPTRYDRAVALESYLRTYTYSLTVPPIPINHDLVDYFLFDLKRGYCDYYATSMVVMARAIGLPARLVVGYAPGTYLPEGNYYMVTAAEAHSWAEIYFPGYGWQEFEPTGGARPVPALRPQITTLPPPNFTPPRPPTMSSRLSSRLSTVSPWLIWLGRGLLETVTIFLLIAMTLLLGDYAYLRFMSPTQTLQVIFWRLEWLGQKLFRLEPLAETPYEFAHHFSQHLPQAETQLQPLTDLYIQVNYGFYTMNRQDQQQCLQKWHQLCWQIVKKVMSYK